MCVLPSHLHKLDGIGRLEKTVYCDALGSVFSGVRVALYRQHRWKLSYATLSVRRLEMLPSIHWCPLGDISTATVPMMAAVLNQVAMVRRTGDNFDVGTESRHLGSVIQTAAKVDCLILLLTSCAPVPITSLCVRFSTWYPSCMNNIDAIG